MFLQMVDKVVPFTLNEYWNKFGYESLHIYIYIMYIDTFVYIYIHVTSISKYQPMDFSGISRVFVVFVDHRSLKCVFTHQELPRGKVLKEFPLTMVGISREEDLGDLFPFFLFSFLEQGEFEFFLVKIGHYIFCFQCVGVGSGEGGVLFWSLELGLIPWHLIQRAIWKVESGVLFSWRGGEVFWTSERVRFSLSSSISRIGSFNLLFHFLRHFTSFSIPTLTLLYFSEWVVKRGPKLPLDMLHLLQTSWFYTTCSCPRIISLRLRLPCVWNVFLTRCCWFCA